MVHVCRNGKYCPHNSANSTEIKFCFHGKTIVEDGNHFLLDCSPYEHDRKGYSKVLDTCTGI